MSKQPQTIAIVGAGIMGLTTAYALKRNFPDATITIADPKGYPAKNASYMAGGMLAPYSEIEHMPHDYICAGHDGITFWKQATQELNTPMGFEENGSLFLSHSEDRHILERYKSHLESHSYDLDKDIYKTCNQADIHHLEPDLAQRFDNGLFLKNEAHINPAQTMTALFRAIKPRTTELCDIKELSKTTDWVIDCRGYSAAKEDKDLRGVKGETLTVRNTYINLNRPVRLMHPRYPLYIIPREDNIFMIGATSIESADNEISLRSVMELTSALYALHPSFGEASILETKAGIRPSYPDNLPRITIKDNVIACNGLFRHGYLLSPMMAECVRDHINGKEHKYMHLFSKGEKSENHTQRAA